MAVRYFNTTGWGGTGTPTDLGEIDGVHYYRHNTFQAALSASSAGDIIEPDPDAAAFLDANGFRLRVVTLTLAANLTISKSVTIRGGAYRLRFDGVGAYYITASAALTCVDVDFVRLYSAIRGLYLRSTASFTRCFFGGLNTVSILWCEGTTTLSDCAFVSNKTTYNIDYYVAETGSLSVCRSVLYSTLTNMIDSITLRNLSQSSVDAIGFVKPPKVYDTSNPGYYTDGTAWSNTDWEDVDLRLLSTSSYATGNSLTSADGDVYDLAGNKRTVGGAKGAFEVVDADRYSEADRYSTGNNTWYSDAARTTSASLTSASKCYVEENSNPVLAKYGDSVETVAKLYVPGWTHVTYAAGAVDSSDIVLGLGASATAVYPTIRRFTSTATGGSGSGELVSTTDNVSTYRYSTFYRALAAAKSKYGDIIEPDPDAAAFLDSNGFRLRVVTLTLAANLTISKSVTIRGGAYRLRFDGVGAYQIRLNGVGACYYDVDWVRMGGDWSYIYHGDFTRCGFYGVSSSTQIGGLAASQLSFTDCAWAGYNAERSFYLATYASLRFTRCVIANGTSSTAKVDCINLYNLDQTAVDAIGFVKPPKVYDTSNPGYYTDGTAWTNTDWESVDLRLLSTSSYATGNSLTSADGDVYDLAGNLRTVGGAVGAFECLSDVTRYYSGGAWYSDAAHTTTASAPTSSDVCYLEENAAFSDKLEFAKLYLAGWSHLKGISPHFKNVIKYGLQSSIEFTNFFQSLFGDDLDELAMRSLGLPFNDETFKDWA